MRGNAAGFTEWLLFHLWKQNEETGQSCPYVLVPDTVIYRWGRPFFWYFTTHTGELLRKSKNKVSHKFIEQEFAGGATEEELIASYLSFQDEDKSESTSKATSYFFTKASFCTSHSADFVLNKPKALSGLLQKWVEPKGRHNCNTHSAMIKVVWSPQLAIMERRINKHGLTDPTIDFYDRLATYEGLELHSTPESLTVPQLVSDIQKICTAIVDHIKLISGGNVSITRLTLYFKQDPADRLWLLFCGGVQIFDLVSEKSKGPTSELELRLPPAALSKQFLKGTNYFELQANRAPCPGCNYLSKLDSLYDIRFDLLVTCSEQGFPDPPNKAEVAVEKIADEEQTSDAVPDIIKRAVAGITNEKYLAMRNNLAWMNSTTKVCESCYLHYSGFVVFGNPAKERKSVIKPVKQGVVLTGEEELLRENSLKKSFSWGKPRLLSPTSFLSTPKTVNMRSHQSYYKGKKKEKGGKDKLVPKLEGRFTAKKLPSLINIYTSQKTLADLTRSTGVSSQNSSHRQIRLSELSPDEQTSLLQNTIKSLKMCLLDGVHP